MNIRDKKVYRRSRIKQRIKKIIEGSAERPRLTVFRSNKEIYAQVIDDANGVTIIAASSQEKGFSEKKITKIEQAKMVGKLIAEKAKKKNINSVVFDRNGYLYHGRVRFLAEAARENGLKF